MQNNLQEEIEKIKNDSDYLKEVYIKHKSYCINLMRSMISNININIDIEDIYQDAIIVFNEKASSAKVFIILARPILGIDKRSRFSPFYLG